MSNPGENTRNNQQQHPEVSAFVNDFLEYKLRESGYQWSRPTSGGEAEQQRTIIASKVGSALRDLADEFSLQFKEHFVEMCDKLEISESSLKPTIVGIANELFNEGIKWARIVALFVFASELALHCKDRRNFSNLINVIAGSLSTYISEKLLPWINDHGGWEGLIDFNEGSDAEQTRNGRWPSVTNLFCIGISALGALSLGALLTKS